jgi:hypothetical protein
MYVVVVLGRVVVALGRVAGALGGGWRETSRCRAHPHSSDKIEILFHPIVESNNQTIKQSDNQNGVLQTSWIHDRGRDEETR